MGKACEFFRQFLHHAAKRRLTAQVGSELSPIVYKTLGREVPDYSVDRSASLSPAVSYLACRPWTMGTLHLVP